MNLTSSILPRSSALIISVFLWLGAFGFSLLPIVTLEAECFLLAVILLLFSALFALAGSEHIDFQKIVKAPASLAFMAFWILSLISVFMSEVKLVAFIYFCFFSVFPIGFLLAQGWEAWHWKICGLVMALVMAGLGGCSLIQFFFMPGVLFNGYASWPMPNPNSLAALYVMGFYGALGWMLAGPSRMQSNSALLLAIILGSAILATGSRGAFVAMFVCLPILLLFARAFVKKHWRCLSLACVLIPALFFGLGFFSHTAISDPVTEILRMDSMTLHNEWGQRQALWESAWKIINAHFWIGTGVGTFFLYYPEVRGADFGTAGFMAHFEPLQFWAEQGVFSVLAFYALLVFVALRTFKTVRGLLPDDVRRVHVLTPFCALAAITLHTHVSYNFHVLSLLMLAGVLLAYWFVHTEHIEAIKKPTREDGALRYGFALPLVIMLGVFGPWQASEILMNRAQLAADQGHMKEFYAGINRAGQLSGNRNARALMGAASVPLGAVYMNGALMDKTELGKLYAQGRDLLLQAEHENPRLGQIYYHHADLLRSTEKFVDFEIEETQEFYLKKALQVDPLFTPARIMLANIMIRENRADDAYKMLLEGLEWPYTQKSAQLYYDKVRRMATERQDQAVLERLDVVTKRFLKMRQNALSAPSSASAP